MAGRALGALVGASLLAGVALAASLELSPLLRPSLEGFEPAVATLLGERQSALDELLSTDDATATEAARELGELGRLYLAYNLPEAAESCLINAERLDPEEPLWIYLRGMLQQQAAELESARSSFQRVRRLTPAHPAATLRLAQIEFELDRPTEAQSLYESIVDEPGFEAAANYGLGRIAAGRGDLETAIARFEVAVAAQPEAASPRYQLATAYRRNDQPEKAREQLALRGKGSLSFPDPVAQSVGQDAEGAQIYLSAGRKARQAQDYDAALAAFRKAVAEEPDEPSHRKTLASTLLEIGRLEEAASVYREVLVQLPDDPTALYNLATALLELERVGEAREVLTTLTRVAPDHADGRVNLATLFERDGDFRAAEALLAEAIELEPYDVSLRLRRASVLTSLGRHAEARVTVSGVLEQDPGNPEALLVLGTAHEAQGSSEEAIAAWEQVVAVGAEPEVDGRARYLLGRSLLARGDAVAAARHLRIAVEALEGSPDVRILLAGALGAQGDFDGAAEQYGRLLEHQPTNQNARFGKAISLLLAGREAEAISHLESSVELEPASLPLKHLLARVLAAAADASLRDGARALALATEVFQSAQTLDHAETLAMAHAELGQFAAAIEWQTRIIERARAMGQSGQLSRLEARREQFQRGETAVAPWRP